MKRYIVDTNLILRFLTGEPASHAKLAAELFQQGEDGKIQLHISPIVVAETVFVLTGKIYGCARSDVADQLLQFLGNPSFKVQEMDEIVKAVTLFKAHKIDFADAYLAAKALISDASIATFDKDFAQIKGLESLILTETA
jgi:predicted nucleic acid-binding protein